MTPPVHRPSGLPAFVRRIHFYAGVFVAPFIFIAALSGALYAVAPSLENIVYHDALQVRDQAGGVPLASQIEAARATHPDMDVAQVWPAATGTDTSRVLLIDESIAANQELRSVFVNPHTGEVTGDEPSYSGVGELPLRHWISALHKSLHLGEPGEMYSELAASWLWVVALGGLYLWWRLAKGRVFVRLRTRTGRRRGVLNLHGIAGTWLIAGMLALSVTGITWSMYGGANVNRTVDALGMKAQPIETSLVADAPAAGGAGHAEHAGHAGHSGHNAAPAPLSSGEIAGQAATVQATARAEGLTGPLRLLVPEDTAHAWQASERWVPWRTSSDAVSVNGASGEVVDTLPFRDLPVFSKLTSWGIYLHMGIMFGLPLQIALLAVALGICAMVVLGYMMWWRRRPTRNAVAGIPGCTHLTAGDWGAIVLVGVAVGLFLPLFGVSFAAMVVADRLLAARARRARCEPEPETVPAPARAS